MVWRKLGPTTTRRSKVEILISLLPLLLFSLMFDVFSGGDGRRTGFAFVQGAVGKIDGGAGAIFWITGGGVGANGGYGSPSNVGIAIAVTVMAGIAVAATLVYSNRGHLQSPWSRRRRKNALQPKQWRSLFDEDGKLCDGGVKFLKKARSGVCYYLDGVHPSIRAEVWPFLLGVYDLKSSKEERDAVKTKNRKEYEKLRKQCQQTYIRIDKSTQIKDISRSSSNEDSKDGSQVLDSSAVGNTDSSRNSVSPEADRSAGQNQAEDPGGDGSEITCKSDTGAESESSDSDSSEEADDMHPSPTPEKVTDETDINRHLKDDSDTGGKNPIPYRSESFSTWQRIIRLDAIRANDEWIVYTPSQAAVSLIKAHRSAESVCLKEYNHLEACRIFHAARLVSILEAYALFDPEIGYCQGMSDLLSPIISVVEDDSEAFRCFVGFMKKARHNFRLDEVGIRRQLNIVSKIIKGKDSHLYRHLEELQAEDCFFVYRMVVVLFRRELNFEQTLCLWEVMWADQTAIRAGITKSAWGRMRMRAPPTDDLLLYAIAACVLQRRKQIIEKYSSMDEILRECNSMAGHLDVWKLLDDAHDLVVTLHDKI
ncbi:GTPase-activating protein GYP7-like isoform X1 [Cynara cardunculus var. scolymus]|uniref:GTPase-activating protein GYP7-like isoform X1 n=1 Tax=Cynara cardunculus var. scolymus TaxID=59895 RepID=UPI000D63003D|nr:GTPase-activating protein GYP7-like isoform X1 [Cynara cardunculus var. scolymus]